MFDRIYINCPRCERAMEFQSKSGECKLADYTLENAPTDVFPGIEGDYGRCECGFVGRLRLTQEIKFVTKAAFE